MPAAAAGAMGAAVGAMGMESSTKSVRPGAQVGQASPLSHTQHSSACAMRTSS